MTQLSSTALEAAARDFSERTGFKIDFSKELATAAITAYLAQAEKEGWVMVRKEGISNEAS